jgi:predicted nucleic acid-binding protein
VGRLTPLELADTSAWSWQLRHPPLQADFARRVANGEIVTCRPVVLELLWQARDVSELAGMRDGFDTLRDLPVRRREWDRAADVMHALAERGPLHHRSAKMADLLIAAAAEAADVPVLHYDRHFDLIAEVTGQPVRALAPLGSL